MAIDARLPVDPGGDLPFHQGPTDDPTETGPPAGAGAAWIAPVPPT